MVIFATFGVQNTGRSVFCALYAPDGSVVRARSAGGITERPGTGIFALDVEEPSVMGNLAVWDIDGTAMMATEDFSTTKLLADDMAAVQSALDALDTSQIPGLVEALTTVAGYLDTEIADILKSTVTDAAGLNIAADIVALKAVADAVKLITDTITGPSITVLSPVAANGNIEIVRADDYYAEDGRSIQIPVADPGHLLGLDAAVTRMHMEQATWDTSFVEVSEAGYTVHFEPTTSLTAAIEWPQSYQVKATLLNGHVVTLREGIATPIDTIPEV